MRVKRHIIILLSLFILLSVALVLYNTKSDVNNPINNGENIDDDLVNNEEKLKINITNLETVFYKSDDIDFNFCISKLQVSSNKDIEINNSNFKTNEGIRLSEVNKYLEELEDNNINIKEDINNDRIEVSKKEKELYLFIPTNKDMVDVVFEYENNDDYFSKIIKINLDESIKGNIESIKDEENVNVGDDYIFNIKSIRNLTYEDVYYVNEDNERFQTNFPSNISVIGINIDIELLVDKIKIDHAFLVVNGKEYNLIPKEYDFDELVELNKREINENIEGYLIFEITEQDFNIENTEVILKIKITDKNEYVEVPIN